MKITVKKIDSEKIIGRMGWLIVIVCAFGMSAWSLYSVARYFHVPIVMSIFASTIFDGTALVSANQALKYARTNADSGLGPRLTMITAAGISAYLNAEHAILDHYARPAIALFMIPSIFGVWVYENHQRWERRNALRRVGRVAERLPVFGRDAYMFHFWKTLKRMSSLSEMKIERTGSDSELDAMSMGNGDAESMRIWAQGQGINVGKRGRIPSKVRELYNAEFRSIENTNDESVQS